MNNLVPAAVQLASSVVSLTCTFGNIISKQKLQFNFITTMYEIIYRRFIYKRTL